MFNDRISKEDYIEDALFEARIDASDLRTPDQVFVEAEQDWEGGMIDAAYEKFREFLPNNEETDNVR